MHLSRIGLTEQLYSACRLLSIDDQRAFVASAVKRLGAEVEEAFWGDPMTDELAAKMAEFIVWHTLLDGVGLFEERHAFNTQGYEWLGSASNPGIDIYGASNTGAGWVMAVVEIKWSKIAAYSQITSTTQGLVHDLKKLFDGPPSNRLMQKYSALKAQMRPYADCREALAGLVGGVRIGSNPKDTRGVLFVGFFVSDLSGARTKSGFDTAYASLLRKALDWGWDETQIARYVLTGRELKTVLEAIAQGRV
ncbi:MAG TPA: hypothetical protein VFS21_01415 [Roseiflexaceae bacterium]|nr:hypothetical protein [Roseiflexaceae bacterium]